MASDQSEKDNGDDPRSWSIAKRVFHTSVPAANGFLCPFGSSVYTPAVQQVELAFHVSAEVALLPFVLYLLGLSFGPVIAAPISETLGRRYVYLLGLPLFGAFTIGAGFSQSIGSLIVCRFLAGLFSSPGLSIGIGMIADVWPVEKRAFAMAIYISCVQMGSISGPLIGGFVVAERSWRWTQWTICFGVAVVFVATLCMTETYKPVIEKRASISQKPEKSEGLSTEPVSRKAKFYAYIRTSVIRPLHMLCTEVIVFLFCLYIAVTFALINAFLAAFSYVFQTVYGMSISSVGLTFLGQAVGSLVGMILSIAVTHFYYSPRSRALRQAGSQVPPELRLAYAFAGAPMLPISLFIFGWTARQSIHWIVPVIAEGIFACGALMIFMTVSLYLTDVYGARYGASAASANTFMRYFLSTAFPLFAVQIYENLGIGWASSLLGFITAMLVPIPFVFFIWGSRIRAKSKYASGE